MAISGLARWLATHLVPYPDLLGKHHTGLVAAAVRLDYDRPHLRFHDADWLTATVTLEVSETGTWMRLRTKVTTPAGPAATAVLELRPVNLGDERESMSALAGCLPEQLLSAFAVEERFTADPRAATRAAVPPKSGAELSEAAQYPLQLYRSHCEVADQWSFIEMSELFTQARERMFFGHPQPPDRLRLAVSAPVRSFSALLRRPMYSFDECTGTTRAFDAPNGVVFVHALRRSSATGPNISAWELIETT
ncbi:hypothetical protein [Streptomyces sp. NPDC002520]